MNNFIEIEYFDLVQTRQCKYYPLNLCNATHLLMAVTFSTLFLYKSIVAAPSSGSMIYCHHYPNKHMIGTSLMSILLFSIASHVAISTVTAMKPFEEQIILCQHYHPPFDLICNPFQLQTIIFLLSIDFI